MPSDPMVAVTFRGLLFRIVKVQRRKGAGHYRRHRGRLRHPTRPRWAPKCFLRRKERRMALRRSIPGHLLLAAADLFLPEYAPPQARPTSEVLLERFS